MKETVAILEIKPVLWILIGFNADMDLASNLNADLDSGSQINVDPSEFAVTKGFA
jgi:hypothetical protein